ncbi:hypothetical protein G6F60_003470 [Rhizopus arrhizus]|nr:hypothetical protein G6F24_002320 [Rhizopus arrhizus]KAG1381713.1 hypothetical protein G6F61_002923 [Rhizopus arrhizus]KAG1405654.1 hypothetical protein G6F60_003470 [Rhizopus arrhizus]
MNKKLGWDNLRKTLEEDCLVPEAAKKASIPRSTAYRMWNEFTESSGKELPGFKKLKTRQSWKATYLDRRIYPVLDQMR